ncbi:head protein [Klebsiella phage VLCpiA3a]|nr:head protein [Klebsiella phage VLCpiA3a]
MNVVDESAEPVAEAEVVLTPQQKAAITRARNKALKEAQTE